MLPMTSLLTSSAPQETLAASPSSCFENEVVFLSLPDSLAPPSFFHFLKQQQAETYFNARLLPAAAACLPFNAIGAPHPHLHLHLHLPAQLWLKENTMIFFPPLVLLLPSSKQRELE